MNALTRTKIETIVRVIARGAEVNLLTSGLTPETLDIRYSAVRGYLAGQQSSPAAASVRPGAAVLPKRGQGARFCGGCGERFSDSTLGFCTACGIPRQNH